MDQQAAGTTDRGYNRNGETRFPMRYDFSEKKKLSKKKIIMNFFFVFFGFAIENHHERNLFSQTLISVITPIGAITEIVLLNASVHPEKKNILFWKKI